MISYICAFQIIIKLFFFFLKKTCKIFKNHRKRQKMRDIIYTKHQMQTKNEKVSLIPQKSKIAGANINEIIP